MYEEKDVYAILGLEQPAEDPAPAADDNTAGVVTGGEEEEAKSREVAEPGQQVEESENSDLTQEKDTETDNGSAEDSKDKTMSREERAKFAAQRRKAEQDAAIQAALQQQKAEFDRQMEAFLQGLNLKNPVTGNAVTNMDEYNAMQKDQQQRQLQKNLREGKLLPEDLQALIRSEMQEKEKTAPAAQVRQPAQQVSQAQIDAELAEISRLDPSVKNLEDILALETGASFARAVKQGASFIDAFKMANFDRLQKAGREESAKRAQQAALNNQRSKEHLTVTAQTGKGSEAVPRETMEMYRMLMPGKSDDEITAHYNKTIKSMK